MASKATARHVVISAVQPTTEKAPSLYCMASMMYHSMVPMVKMPMTPRPPSPAATSSDGTRAAATRPLYLNGPGANRIPAAADITAVCRSLVFKGFQSAVTRQGSGVLAAAGAASCCLLHGMWGPSRPERCQMHRGWTRW